MTDIQRILDVLRNHATREVAIALATVVKVQGSAYRRPGARMLILSDGRRIGSVSGGCLESDVVERAKVAAASGTPCYVLYDSQGTNGDVVVELGCNGAVGILIEPIDRAVRTLDFLETCLQKRQVGVIATVFESSGQWSTELAHTLELSHLGDITSSISHLSLRDAISQDAIVALHEQRPRIKTYDTDLGVAEVLIEVVLPPISLLICGAGQDAVPLAELANQLGWQVTVTDPRKDYLTEESFPKARLVASSQERLLDHIFPDARTVAVLMTHSYSQDLTLLKSLLPSEISYLGILGPRVRTERLLCDLATDGFLVTQEQLDRLFSPAGLDIGSETPDEIALAIAAEIKATLAGRDGTSLRKRLDPIHKGILAN